MRLKLFFSSIFILLSSSPILALEEPKFTLCANPSGQIQVSWQEGVHGIVGRSQTYLGEDTVYRLSETTLTQCFCSDEGVGIQTDWWELPLEGNELPSEASGWIYVPDGSVWGLAETSYFARNTDYTCLPESQLQNQSEILGESGRGGEVLGLAATGGTLDLILIFTFGLWLILLALKRLVK